MPARIGRFLHIETDRGGQGVIAQPFGNRVLDSPPHHISVATVGEHRDPIGGGEALVNGYILIALF